MYRLSCWGTHAIVLVTAGLAAPCRGAGGDIKCLRRKANPCPGTHTARRTPKSHSRCRIREQENKEHTLGTTQKSCFPGKLRLSIEQCQLERSGGEFLFKLYKSCSILKIFFLYKKPVQYWKYFFFTWPGKGLMTFTLFFFPLKFR